MNSAESQGTSSQRIFNRYLQEGEGLPCAWGNGKLVCAQHAMHQRPTGRRGQQSPADREEYTPRTTLRSLRFTRQMKRGHCEFTGVTCSDQETRKNTLCRQSRKMGRSQERLVAGSPVRGHLPSSR